MRMEKKDKIPVQSSSYKLNPQKHFAFCTFKREKIMLFYKELIFFLSFSAHQLYDFLGNIEINFKTIFLHIEIF